MIAASAPPATTTSARPERIMSMPYPIASAPEAHALTRACAPALAPSSMLIQPAAPLGISIGTV